MWWKKHRLTRSTQEKAKYSVLFAFLFLKTSWDKDPRDVFSNLLETARNSDDSAGKQGCKSIQFSCLSKE